MENQKKGRDVWAKEIRLEPGGANENLRLVLCPLLAGPRRVVGESFQVALSVIGSS